MATTCAVRGCDSPAGDLFDFQVGGVRLDWAVCAFHLTALKAGEPYGVAGIPPSEILIGSDITLEVVNFKVHTDVSGSQIELILGRDGIEEERVKFRIKPEQLASMCHWAGGGHNPKDAQRSG